MVMGTSCLLNPGQALYFERVVSFDPVWNDTTAVPILRHREVKQVMLLPFVIVWIL